MVCHRRAGKTVATINDLILRTAHCRRSNPRGAYIAPLHKQAKDAAWDYLKDYGLTIPGAEARESELSLELPYGGRVRLYGADNPDALRGIYLDEVVLDEYAQMRDGLWSEVIRPALADREGNATFIGTPMGRNAFASLWGRAESDPAWFSLMLKASESGILPAAELAAARQEMSADQYAQEFECSFDAAVQGTYYAGTDPAGGRGEADRRRALGAQAPRP
jgi:phage terminase large subunit